MPILRDNLHVVSTLLKSSCHKYSPVKYSLRRLISILVFAFLLPHYDEMLNEEARCIPSTSRRILELGCVQERT